MKKGNGFIQRIERRFPKPYVGSIPAGNAFEREEIEKTAR